MSSLRDDSTVRDNREEEEGTNTVDSSMTCLTDNYGERVEEEKLATSNNNASGMQQGIETHSAFWTEVYC